MFAKEIITYLETRFPNDYAEDFDQPKIGLIVGRDDFTVTNLLLSLDLSLEVVKEAIRKQTNFIIVHHPFFFEPLYKVLLNTEQGEVLKLLLTHDISVYAMHTNLDVGQGGVNDTLADLLAIRNCKVDHDVIGKQNYLRFGDIEEITLYELVQNVKNVFHLPGVRVLGDLNQRINRIGVIGGSGAHQNDIERAIFNNCQVLITGEVKLNNAQYAKYLGLSIIEVNHGIEKFVFTNLKKDLEKDLSLNSKVIVSEIETDPLKIIG